MISDKKIYDLQKILHYEFNDVENLKISLVHPSVFIGMKKPKNKNVYEFERLEVLGDRVLGLVISNKLIELYPGEKVGVLDKRFSNLVNKKTCFDVGKKLNLGNYILIGNSKKKQDKIVQNDGNMMIFCNFFPQYF